ncbi:MULTISPECIES: BREX-1 system phosphatase PglZ type A [Flavobacterium]|uniref:BREX-1 system phosphatase PglZ type A n=1 Tax=Flavobacterium TaxID=237 RepID=UPI001FCC14D3|nr:MULTISPECIES: BREX-1 system phosphatase PglZ type A [Flavobacterium]UOK42512.1 BREX-1 system phosphatase PglZ type A [Flavobacterium enshiense]
MFADKVIQTLLQSDKNKLFYFDADGSKREELAAIENAGVKVVEVNQNYFDLKYKLEMEWNNKKIFLYHPFAKPEGKKIKKYPLLDLLSANIELKLDEVSEFIAEYRLKDYHSNLINKYFKLLKTKTNQKKLARILDSENFSEDNLKKGLISIILDFNAVEDKFNCMNKWFTLTLEESKFNKINSTLIELGLEEVVINWFNTLLDTKEDTLSMEAATNWITKLKYNVLVGNATQIVTADTYNSLRIKRTADNYKLLKFFEVWQKNINTNKAIEQIFNTLGSKINTVSVLKWYGTETEYGYYSEEMIDKVLKLLYSEVFSDALKTKEECIRWKREESISDFSKDQIEFLYFTASMYSVLEGYKSFRFNTVEEYIKEYTVELHKVDFNYRKAVIAYDKVRDHLDEFETIALPVFEALNNKYDRFLIEFNIEWQKVLEENKFDFHQIDCNKQFNFYQDNLGEVDYKMAVIISDAFRFELGYELYNDLLADSKNNLTIQPCLASIPSYTNLGMSNLLPNKGITVEKGEQDLVYKINGKPTNSQYRQSILQAVVPESCTIDYAEIIKFDRETGRKFFIENKLVYIYHDWMDAIGDKKRTEHETFEETAKVVEQIKRLIQKIYGWNISYVLVTADHGFLYNYNELKENDRETLPKAKGYSKDNSRFVISEGFEGKQDGYVFDMKKTTNIDTDLKIAIPRAINRYRRQGNIGVQFVHGGASIQELITPVIKCYKQKKETTETVTFRRIDNVSKITTGNIKIVVLQNEPVSNELRSLEVTVGLYDDNGVSLSNEVELICNATSNNPKERVFEIILTLNTQGSKATFCYLKAFDNKDKNKLNPIVLNDLITISTLMGMDF